METGTIVGMIVILGGIWGGFAYFLYLSAKAPSAERDEGDGDRVNRETS